MAPSPVVARWELSRRLAGRRKELGLDVRAITDALGFTRNYWSAVENDRTVLAVDKLKQACEVLQLSDTDRQELLQLREDSRGKGWWDEYPWLSDAFKRFYGMESGASRLRVYDGHIISGILQIEDYTRAIIDSDPGTSPVEVDRLVAIRQRRQRELFDRSNAEVIVLLSEAALRQQVAGPTVQAAQLRRVLRLREDVGERLTIRLLPFEVYPGAIITSMTVSFLEYADNPRLPTIAWQEGVQLLGGVDDTHDEFQHLELVWQVALSRSLDQEARSN